MTTVLATVRSPLARACRRLVVVAVLLVAVGPAVGDAAADQTVRFDGAGDAPQISLIGDSTLTGVRWYADYGDLERYNFLLSAESCRRTVEQSCISREGYRSENVVTAMRSLDGELGEVLVVMSGYNDPLWTIDEAIAAVVAEARSQGVGSVVWLTLRTGDDVDYSDPQEQSSVDTFRVYNEQLVAAADEADGYLQVADWATWSNGATGWFETDGVHLTSRGVDALTTYIAATVQRVLAGEDVTPAEAPWTVLVPGAEGETVASIQRALIAAGVELVGGTDGVYGNDTMAAVAAYQEDNDLQVTGAVDAATARALGVYGESTEPSPASSAPATTTPRTVPSASTAGQAPPSDRAEARSPGWTVMAATAVVVLVVAVVARRRYVVAQRSARRWARVHPSTAPGRSVADLRRDRQHAAATASPGGDGESTAPHRTAHGPPHD